MGALKKTFSMQGWAEKDPNRNSNDRFEEVQHIQGFGSGHIRMEKQNLFSQPKHACGKTLMMMKIIFFHKFSFI